MTHSLEGSRFRGASRKGGGVRSAHRCPGQDGSTTVHLPQLHSVESVKVSDLSGPWKHHGSQLSSHPTPALLPRGSRLDGTGGAWHRGTRGPFWVHTEVTTHSLRSPIPPADSKKTRPAQVRWPRMAEWRWRGAIWTTSDGKQRTNTHITVGDTRGLEASGTSAHMVLTELKLEDWLGGNCRPLPELNSQNSMSPASSNWGQGSRS